MECNFARRANIPLRLGPGAFAIAIGIQLIASVSATGQDALEKKSAKTLEIEFKDGEVAAIAAFLATLTGEYQGRPLAP